MKRWLLLVIFAMLGFFVSGAYATSAEVSDQNVLKFQLVESKTLTKNDINALSMGRNNDGRFGVEIWLTKRFAGQLKRLVKANPDKEVRLKLNGKVIRASVIQSPLGSRFEIADLSQEEANTILGELSKDYSLDLITR